METGSEPPADLELATLRELHALRQALTHLSDLEQRLRSQQAQLHQQINTSSAQAHQARQARLDEQAARAMEQRSSALAEYIRLQEQLERITARQTEIRTRQQTLEVHLKTLQATQRQSDLQLRDALVQSAGLAATPALPTAQRRTAHKHLLWLSGLIVLALVLASLAVTWRLLHSTPSPTTQGSPTPSPLTTNNTPFYHATGGAPSNQTCIDAFGQACYSPEQIQQAFRLNPLYRSGDIGTGQTIILLGAGHTTTLQADLHHFDQTWGLPDPTLTILEPHGPPAPYMCTGGGDDLEEENTLDVEWAHAIAPGAKIVLVIGDNGGGTPEQNCTGDGTLQEDTAYALTNQLGQVISMSYGGSELGNISDTPGDQAAEQRYIQEGHMTFQQATSQQVTVIASAGDDGATNPDGGSGTNAYWTRPNVSWPASDPNVLAVGGTKLSLDAANNYQSETVWDESGFGATGGGLSTVFPEPDYQDSVPNQMLFKGKRGLPDVAFPADNFLVYDSTSPGTLRQLNPAWQHWDIVGGTSVSAPCWAGLVAIADQVRGQPLGLLQLPLYRLQGKGMHDITSGTNSFHGVTGYQAQKGFDLVSGWGTPIADQFIPLLVAAANQG